MYDVSANVYVPMYSAISSYPGSQQADIYMPAKCTNVYIINHTVLMRKISSYGTSILSFVYVGMYLEKLYS